MSKVRFRCLGLLLVLLVFGQSNIASAGPKEKMRAFCIWALKKAGISQPEVQVDSPVTVTGKDSIAQVLNFDGKHLWQRVDLPTDSNLRKPVESLTRQEMASVVLQLQTISRRETGPGGLSIGLEPAVHGPVEASLSQAIAIRASKFVLDVKNSPFSQTIFVFGNRVFIGPLEPTELGSQLWEVVHPSIKKLLLEWVNKNDVAESDPVDEKSVASTNQFFANYGLIPTQGFEVFIKAQSELLATNVIIEVVTPKGLTEYKGPSGYSQSIQDWGGIFRTDNDFGKSIQEGLDDDGEVVVKLSGTIHMKVNGTEISIPSSKHHWTEYMTYDSNGKMAKLRVVMNIDTTLTDPPHPEQLEPKRLEVGKIPITAEDKEKWQHDSDDFIRYIKFIQAQEPAYLYSLVKNFSWKDKRFDEFLDLFGKNTNPNWVLGSVAEYLEAIGRLSKDESAKLYSIYH
jgi:hypothetical protein